MDYWEELCDKVGIEPTEIYPKEQFGSREDYLEFFETIYPKPTAEKREKLEKMICKVNGGFEFIFDKHSKDFNYLYKVSHDYENRWSNDRNEALSGLMLQIKWSDKEKIVIKNIIEKG